MPIPKEKPSINTRAAQYRVCIISRSHELGSALAKLLNVFGHELSTAFDGEEGLKLVLSSKPDVVITCMDLPSFDGFRLGAKIRDRFPNKPVLIAHTSYSIDAVRKKLKDSGFDLAFSKPASVEQLRHGLAFIEQPQQCAEWRI